MKLKCVFQMVAGGEFVLVEIPDEQC